MLPQGASTLWIVLLALPLATIALPSCTTTIDGVQYDLTPLKRPVNAPYTVQDSRDLETNYTFNICDDVDSSVLPQGLQFIPDASSVPAFQIQSGPQLAYQLSSPADSGWSFSLLGMYQACTRCRSLYTLVGCLADVELKARGIMLGYTGGASDWCPSPASGGQASRALRLAVECAPHTSSSSVAYQSVIETQDCHYEIYLKSVFGCPVACLAGSGSSVTVCGGRGVCGFDAAAQAAYCICDKGFDGPNCDKSESSLSCWALESLTFTARICRDRRESRQEGALC